VAIAVVQEFTGPADDRSTTNYDKINEHLGTNANPPAGLILHTAGYASPGVFRIVDVWESEADWETFRDERLMPAVMQLTDGGPPPNQYAYELHHVVRP
jgi:hypothetical protein